MKYYIDQAKENKRREILRNEKTKNQQQSKQEK